jgi:hypothetical protein
MIFNKQGKKLKYTFTYSHLELEQATSYVYLGITFTPSGSFATAKDSLYKKGLKAYFKFCRLISNGTPSSSTYFHIFDHTITPILLYGSEIWGSFSIHSSILRREPEFKIEAMYSKLPADKLNERLCRLILGVPNKTTTAAVTGELGRYPLYIDVVSKMVQFWHRLHTAKLPQNFLLEQALKENEQLHLRKKECWLSSIDFILTELGLKHLLDNPLGNSANHVKNTVKTKLRERFNQQWRQSIFTDERRVHGQKNKLRSYRLFKSHFKREPYIDQVSNITDRNNLIKLRTSSHKLAIETGRYNNIPVDQRLCTMCEGNEVEDEIHFITQCHKYHQQREVLFEIIERSNKNFASLNNSNKFIWLLSNEEVSLNIQLAKFVTECFDVRQQCLSIGSPCAN